jgi:phosphohistidine phosphatase SixA
LEVFILRHGEVGKQVAAGGTDFRRPLTDAGEKEITQVANLLKT